MAGVSRGEELFTAKGLEVCLRLFPGKYRLHVLLQPFKLPIGEAFTLVEDLAVKPRHVENVLRRLHPAFDLETVDANLGQLQDITAQPEIPEENGVAPQKTLLHICAHSPLFPDLPVNADDARQTPEKL